MAFPVIAATNNGDNAAAGTTEHTINLPADIAAGNLLLIIFSCDNSGGAITITWPTSETWTEIFQIGSTGADVCLGAAYRIASGSEGSTVTLTTSAGENSTHQTFRLTGHHASTAPEAGTPAEEGTGSTSADPPNLTPSGWDASAEDTLWLATVGWDSGATTVSGYPANYTEAATSEIVSSNPGGNGMATGSRELSAASENPGAFTLSASDTSVANTIAIRPAAAAGGADTVGPLAGPGGLAGGSAGLAGGSGRLA